MPWRGFFSFLAPTGAQGVKMASVCAGHYSRELSLGGIHSELCPAESFTNIYFKNKLGSIGYWTPACKYDMALFSAKIQQFTGLNKLLTVHFLYSSFGSQSKWLVPALCPSDPDLVSMIGLDGEAVHWSYQHDSWEQHLVESDLVLLLLQPYNAFEQILSFQR